MDFSILARPTDAKTIKFLVEIGRLLSGEVDDDTDDANKKQDVADTLVTYCELLSIDAAQVDIFSRCDSITKTCRSIVSCVVPKEDRIGSSWKKLSTEKQNAILGKIKNCYDFCVAVFYV